MKIMRLPNGMKKELSENMYYRYEDPSNHQGIPDEEIGWWFNWFECEGRKDYLVLEVFIGGSLNDKVT